MTTIDTSSFPTIVCLCGSTRFFREFQKANWAETQAGKIVLTVGCFQHKDAKEREEHEVAITDEMKTRLDALHLRKIDLASEILVLNVDGYVGESTAREIAWAVATGKRVRYLEDRGIADMNVSNTIGTMIEGLARVIRTRARERAATSTPHGASPAPSPIVLPSGRDEETTMTTQTTLDVTDARRAYDRYLWALALARSGGHVDVQVTEDEEADLGFERVLMLRRATVAGAIDATEAAPLVRTPRQLWEFASALEAEDWRFAVLAPNEAT
jgi:hypothetical protein